MSKGLFLVLLVTTMSCHYYISSIKTIIIQKMPIPEKCVDFRQKMQQHFYLNTKDSVIIINVGAFRLANYHDCVVQLTKSQILQLFGKPVYADSVALCYRVMKDSEQNMRYEAHKKVYYGGYLTLVVGLKEEQVTGWNINTYIGLNRTIIGSPQD